MVALISSTFFKPRLETICLFQTYSVWPLNFTLSPSPHYTPISFDMFALMYAEIYFVIDKWFILLFFYSLNQFLQRILVSLICLYFIGTKTMSLILIALTLAITWRFHNWDVTEVSLFLQLLRRHTWFYSHVGVFDFIL